jgi:hypothetical protein
MGLESLAAPLVGAAVTSIFGKKNKSPSAAAAASAAPTQTPEQKQATETLLPVLEGWMTKPPQVNAQKPTQTRITYGGGSFGSGGNQQTQQPQQSNFFGSGGSGGFNGPRMPNTYPGMSNPTVGQPQPQQPQPQQQQSQQPASNAGGFAFTPGQWQQNSANAGIQNQLNQLQSQYDQTLGSAAKIGTRESLESQLANLRTQQSQALMQMQNQYNNYNRNYRGFGNFGNNGVNNFSMSQYGQNINSQYNDQIKGLEDQLMQLNQLEGETAKYQTQMESLKGQLGPDEIYQAGELNIPQAPTSQPILGSVGTYQPIFKDPSAGYQGREYNALISQIMNPVNAPSAAQNPYGAFEQLDYSSEINGLRSPIGTPSATQNPYGTFNNANYGSQIDQLQNYQNDLRQNAADQAGSNLSRELREGYGSDYLKELAASQIDPLKDAYQEAVRQSTADYNRRGLAGSGFESLAKYGAQDDSITSKFLDAAGNVSRDVALRGAEARREDQYRNVSLEDQAIQLANSIGAGMSADQFQRTNAGLNAQMNQDQFNESNRQFWDQNWLNRNQIDYGRGLDQKNLDQTAINLQMNQDQFNESNRQFWDQNQLNRNQVDYGRELDQKDLLKTGLTATMQQDASNEANRQRWSDYDRQLAQLNEGNRQSWANLLNQQQIFDQQQQVGDWARNLDMMKWLVGREDDLTNRQQGFGLDQQKINYDIFQQGIGNLMSFINGQGPVANNMQQNYWNAFNARNQQNQQNQAYNQGIANMATSAVSNWLSPQPTQQMFV